MQFCKLLPLFFLSIVGRALACSCAAQSGSLGESTKSSFESHNRVAVMEVVAIEHRQVTFSWGKATDRWVRFEPHQVFKGLVIGNQQFYATLGGRGTDCEVHARVGELWLVYANNTEPIALSACGDSGRLVSRFQELRYLFQLSDAVASPASER